MKKLFRPSATVAAVTSSAGPRAEGSDERARAMPLRALSLVSIVGLVLASSIGLVAVAAAESGVPYSDPNAVGTIGLCDQAGHQITSGDINTAPFAWRAVSSVPAPAPYNNAYRTAILLAYQPQESLSASEWSGDELTASSRYSNPANPMVAATDGDDSLEDFVQDFHPKWDGYLQLRMYLGTADAQIYSVHYPTLDIHVTGDTWTAVGGGAVNCSSGTATSLESIVLPSTTTTTGTSGGTKSTASDQESHGSKFKGHPVASTSTKSASRSTAGTGATVVAQASSADTEVGTASHRSHSMLPIDVIGASLLALAVFWIDHIARSRRRLTRVSPKNAKKGQ